MAGPVTYKVCSSGGGTSFDGWISATPEGGTKYDARTVERVKGLRSRDEVRAWGRAKIRELRGLPPIVRGPVRGCKTCRFVDKTTGTKRDGPWRCRFVIELPALPTALVRVTADDLNSDRWRDGMWKDSGAECPVWMVEA